jgi:hypothetical protein
MTRMIKKKKMAQRRASRCSLAEKIRREATAEA